MSPFAFWQATNEALRGIVDNWLASPADAAVLFIPMLLFLELPYYLLLVAGVARHQLHRLMHPPRDVPFYPSVSCIITCYSEGEAVKQTLRTLCEQIYPGEIELLPVIDGALRNQATYDAIRSFIATEGHRYPNRRIRPVPKWQRGGRVSSLNAGLSLARGEIVMALDADTSFENDMVAQASAHFIDPRVCAVSGALAVRNEQHSLVTHLQAIEYRLSLMLAKVGLSEFNLVNNVSGAFGVFRRSVLETAGGWNTGSAEDLDMTLRLKQYFRRNGLRIVFEPRAMGYTDAPDTWQAFFKQRLRWDGDLAYMYLEKHWKAFQRRLVGGRNLLILVWGGLLFQIVSPFVILFYMLYLLWALPLPVFVAVNLVITLFYLAIAFVLYLVYLTCISRQPRRDLPDLLLLPAFSLFLLVNRLWSAVALVNEIWRKGHEETNMAPWWVLQRNAKNKDD